LVTEIHITFNKGTPLRSRFGEILHCEIMKNAIRLIRRRHIRRRLRILFVGFFIRRHNCGTVIDVLDETIHATHFTVD